jgi:integrase
VCLFKDPRSPYWQTRVEIAGREVKRSPGTRDRRAAQEFEEQLRRDLWRQIKLGEKRSTWADAVERCRLEDSRQKSWERTERSIAVLNEYIESNTLLTEITYESLLTMRSLLERRTCQGNGLKTKRTWNPSTCNRVLAVAGFTLKRCASRKWGNLIDESPEFPLFELREIEPKWITREQAHVLLGRFPEHTRDMVIFALATGLRKSNVAELEWSRIDLARRCCYIPGRESKSGEPTPAPLNEDATAVLERWLKKHEDAGEHWTQSVHRYVFVYRRRAPIQKLTTAMWRRECKAVGLEGVTFHSMRHSWASWQVQAKTPLRMLQELAGWADLQMPMRYTHLDPRHLAEYADRTLLGPSPCGLSGGVPVEGEEDITQPLDFGGKGGTRTRRGGESDQ